MADILPAGAIPVDQAQPDAPQMDQQAMPQGIPEGAIPVDSVQTDEDKYGTPGQTAAAAAEAFGRGLAGPVATMIEKGAGVPAEDIKGREKAHPYVSGLGEVGGLTAGALTGTGEAALMEKVGQAAMESTHLAAPATYAARVGSSIVKNAAEMAVYQSADEVNKYILQEPVSVQSAIADVGLSSALGGAAGGFITGTISPLWRATAGPKVTEYLGALKPHLNSGSKELESAGKTAASGLTNVGAQVARDAALDENSSLNKNLKTLGIDVSPVMRAAMSGDPKTIQIFNELREAQHPEVLAGLKSIPEMVSQSVSKDIGVPLEEAFEYSKADAGHDMLSTFEKEYKEKYSPIAKDLEIRNNTAAKIDVPDEARRDFGGRIVERGMADFGTDSPYYPTYEHYAQRILAKDTIGGLDQLKTELFNKAKSLSVDNNEKNALRNIRSMITDFQEAQIERQGELGNIRLPNNEGLVPTSEVLAQRQAANAKYKSFAKMSDELSDHLGTGDFKGAQTFKDKLSNFSPEQLVDRFSPKGNVNSISFLSEHFPETLAKVREIEAKKFLSPAVVKEQGEHSLNVGKLNRMLEKTKKGSPEYADFVLPKAAQDKIVAAQDIVDRIPGIKSSGTAGWMTKMMRHVPASAMSVISMLMGHNPIAGYLLGEMAERLGRDLPDAMKLSYLKYLGTDKEVSAEGFHSMFNMIAAVQRGESKILNGAKNVLKAGALVTTADQKSTLQERAKLDKIVSTMIENSNKLPSTLQNSQLQHYMPEHQTQAAQTVTQQMQYLQNLKPKSFQSSPLDKPIEPSKAEMARYNRALDVANNPLLVMQRVKDGTLQMSDIQDLQNLYPAVYQRMIQALTNQVAHHVNKEDSIPYNTRMGLSLFLGQPLDTSMQASSIIAAQPKPVAPPQQQNPNGNKGSKSTSKLGKENKAYMTQDQAAEKRSAVRD